MNKLIEERRTGGKNEMKQEKATGRREGMEG